MKTIIINDIKTNYSIFEDGRVKNNTTGKFLKGQENIKNQYRSYNLTLPDGSKKRVYEHRLVALHYLDTPEPERTEVNHIDGNKLNNHYTNLEWVTSTENKQHAIKNGLYDNKFKPIYQFDKDKKLVRVYKGVVEATEKGMKQATLYEGLRTEPAKLVKGYYWRYNNAPFVAEEKRKYGGSRRKPVEQLTLEGQFIATFPSAAEASRQTGVPRPNISKAALGTIGSAGGYKWNFVE